MSIIAGALALAVAVSPAAHASGTVDQPPRTKAERIAHHQHVVHHRHVVKQRIRERQHGSTTPTPPVKTPPPPVKTPDPVKPTPVTVRPAAPTHQVVVPVHHAVHHKVHHRVVVTPVRPDVVPIAAAPVRHRQAAPAAVVHHGPRPEARAAAPAMHVPAAPKPTPAATPKPHSDAQAIVTVPRHVAQYVKHEVDSMLPAVKVGFGLLCVIGLLMMGYAVAIGRRPTA